MKVTVSHVEQICVLRESGYCISEISSRVGLSMSTVKQVLKKFPKVRKGSSLNSLIEESKKKLIESTTLHEELAHEAAKGIRADLHLAFKLRNQAASLMQELEDNLNMTTVQKCRAFVSVATTLSLAQTVTTRALEFTKSFENDDVDALPSLRVESYTSEEISEIQKIASMSDTELSAYQEQQNDIVIE